MTCETENMVELAKVVVGGTILASLIQAVRQWFQPSAPQVREVAYTLDVQTQDGRPPYREAPTLLISKVRTGGPPWQTFPPKVKRRHLERLYDVAVRDGRKPTEKAVLVRGVLTREELRVLRDWLYRTGRVQYDRNGDNSGWNLNAQGKADLTFWVMRLSGRLPVTPPPRPKQITRPRVD